MDIEDIKQQFSDWNEKKINHHIGGYNPDRKDVYFYEREVWWTALGKNIGYELDGKHELFERPVLILKKYSESMCFVLPLTTKIKEPKVWYQYLISIEERQNAINLSQGRTISSDRLLRKIARIEEAVYGAILDKFIESFKNNL